MNTRTALTSRLEWQPAWLSQIMPRPRHMERRIEMADDLKGAIDQIANSLQTVTLLSTQLRRDLGESAQRAVALEAAADQAVRVLKRLQPKKPR